MVRVKKYKKRRATAAVEAALMMPMVMLMTFALIKYGWLFVKVQQVNNAARHGARVAARVDSTDVLVNDEIGILMSKMWFKDIPEPDGWYDTPTISPGPVEDLATGTIVTVEIVVNYGTTKLNILPTLFVPVPDKIKGTASMAKE